MYNQHINKQGINFVPNSISQSLGYGSYPTVPTSTPTQDAWAVPDYSNEALYGTVTPMVAAENTPNTISGVLNNVPQGYVNIPSQDSGEFFSWQDSKPRQIANQAVNNIKQMSFMDKTKAVGNTLGTLANAYMGYKNYKLAKDQLAFSKQAYNTNLQNQRKMVNSQLEDRQARRVRENIANGKSAGTSVSEYMAKYGV